MQTEEDNRNCSTSQRNRKLAARCHRSTGKSRLKTGSGGAGDASSEYERSEITRQRISLLLVSFSNRAPFLFFARILPPEGQRASCSLETEASSRRATRSSADNKVDGIATIPLSLPLLLRPYSAAVAYRAMTRNRLDFPLRR